MSYGPCYYAKQLGIKKCDECKHGERWDDDACKMWQDCDGYWQASMGEDL